MANENHGSPVQASSVIAASRVTDFYSALREVERGMAIYRQSWGDEDVFGAMVGDRLKIHYADGRLLDWIIGPGDLEATDWVVRPWSMAVVRPPASFLEG